MAPSPSLRRGRRGSATAGLERERHRAGKKGREVAKQRGQLTEIKSRQDLDQGESRELVLRGAPRTALFELCEGDSRSINSKSLNAQLGPPGRLGTKTGRMATWPVDVLYGAWTADERLNDRRSEVEDDGPAAAETARGRPKSEDEAAREDMASLTEREAVGSRQEGR